MLNTRQYYNVEDYPLEDIFALADIAAQEGTPSAVNYRTTDEKYSFKYLLLVEKRLSVFTCVYDDEQLVAFSGGYPHDENVFIGTVRLYVSPKYRKKWLSGPMLEKQEEYAKANNYKYLWLTYNEYNRHLVTIIKRASEGKAIGFGINTKIPEVFKGFKVIDEPKIIKYTKQYILEKEL